MGESSVDAVHSLLMSRSEGVLALVCHRNLIRQLCGDHAAQGMLLLCSRCTATGKLRVVERRPHPNKGEWSSSSVEELGGL